MLFTLSKVLNVLCPLELRIFNIYNSQRKLRK